MTRTQIKTRLKYLHNEITNERISYAEIAELQSLAEYIDPADTLLREWAGILECSGNDAIRANQKESTP